MSINNYVKIEMTTKQKSDVIKIIKAEYENSNLPHDPFEFYWVTRAILNNEIPLKLKGIKLYKIIEDIINIVPDIKYVKNTDFVDKGSYLPYKPTDFPGLLDSFDTSQISLPKDKANKKSFNKSKSPEELILGIIYYDYDKPITSDVLADFMNDILFDYIGPIYSNPVWDDDYSVYGIIFATKQLEFKFCQKVFQETLSAVEESDKTHEVDIDIEFDDEFDLDYENLHEEELYQNDIIYQSDTTIEEFFQDSTLKYLEDREPVNLRFTKDSGFSLWIIEAVSDSFCIACFPTKEEAEEYIRLNGLPLRNIIEE